MNKQNHLADYDKEYLLDFYKNKLKPILHEVRPQKNYTQTRLPSQYAN